MKWIKLNSAEQLHDLQTESLKQPVIIFKHSTSCSISRMVLDRLERNWKDEDVHGAKPYFLDLLSYREISNQIANAFDVKHESPQVLIVHEGKAVFHTSHYEIDFTRLKNALKESVISKN
jgi:bacillithiol system protein YtxJ